MANTSKTTQSTGMSEDTKTIITVILLVCAYPIGVIFMWFWTRWPKWVKVVLTLPVVLAILGIIAAISLVALNPSKQIIRAKCIKMCEYATNKPMCIQQCVDTAPRQ